LNKDITINVSFVNANKLKQPKGGHESLCKMISTSIGAKVMSGGISKRYHLSQKDIASLGEYTVRGYINNQAFLF
jgi:hypothetical protein